VKYLKDGVESVLKYCGRVVSSEHGTGRWVHVRRVKRLEEMCWVEETIAIMIDDDAYFAYIMVRSMHLFLQS
jgi:hypothetical protein